MTWQTDMLHWMPFPWACENADISAGITDLDGFFEPGEEPECPDGNEVAILCRANGYRILTSECTGMNCEYCKPHGAADFVAHLKGLE